MTNKIEFNKYVYILLGLLITIIFLQILTGFFIRDLEVGITFWEGFKSPISSLKYAIGYKLSNILH